MRRLTVAATLLFIASLGMRAWAADAPPDPPSSASTARGPGGGEITVRWSAPGNILAPAPTGYNIHRGSTTAIKVAARDDDDEADASYTFDYTDDTAVKRLIPPSDSLTFASGARLWVHAKALSCNNRGNSISLRINGTAVTTFDRCAIWPSDVAAFRSIDVPLSRITAGGTNTFEFRVQSGYSWSFPMALSLDKDIDAGRTDAAQNGIDASGELMWWLEIDRTRTNDDAVSVGTAAASATSYLDGGLASATTYYYFVKAVNGTAESSPTPIVLGTTYAVIGPPPPPVVTNGRRRSLDIAWQAPNAGNQPTPTGFRIYRGEGASPPVAIVDVGASTRSYSDTSLAEATSYTYQVSAINIAGEGPTSSPVTGTTYGTGLAGPPAISAMAGGVTVSLTWVPSTPAGQEPATSFRLYRTALAGPGPRELVVSTTATSFSDAGRTPETSYRYEVTGVNEAGEGPPSSPIDVTTFAIPGPVQGLNAIPAHCAGSIVISWSAPAPGTGGPTAGYRISRGTAAGSESPVVDLPANITSYSDSSRPRGFTYHYKVSAINDAGASVPRSAAVAFPDWGCWDFSSDQGFTKKADRPTSEIGWNAAAGWVDVSAQRSDTQDEIFARGLGARFSSETTDFSVTVRWASLATGSSQGVFPVFLSRAGVSDVSEAPSTIYAYFSGGDAYLGSRPGYYLRYRDLSGRQRIDGGFIPVGSGGSYLQGVQIFDHRITIDYKVATRVLTMKVTTPQGGVVGSSTITLGAGSGDGFIFDEIGIAAHGQGGLPDQALYGYVDDLFMWHRGSAPMPPVATASSSFGDNAEILWTASAYDGSAPVTAYRLYRVVGSSESLIGEFGPTFFSFVDTSPPTGQVSYRVTAVNSFGEGQRSDAVDFVSTRR